MYLIHGVKENEKELLKNNTSYNLINSVVYSYNIPDNYSPLSGEYNEWKERDD